MSALTAYLSDLDEAEKAIVIRAACQCLWVGSSNEIMLLLPGLEAFVVNGLAWVPQDTTASPHPHRQLQPGLKRCQRTRPMLHHIGIYPIRLVVTSVLSWARMNNATLCQQ
jgi:hypothetical protein